MARFYAMNYYKVTFTRLDDTTYDIYVKAFNEQDAIDIITNKELYEKVIDLEGNYSIKSIPEIEFNKYVKKDDE